MKWIFAGLGLALCLAYWVAGQESDVAIMSLICVVAFCVLGEIDKLKEKIDGR